MRWATATGFWVVACVVVVGCAGVAPAPESKADSTTQLLQRAQAKWDAMVRGDFKASYEFLSPGAKQVESYEMYSKKLNAGFWKAARVRKAECQEADVCIVLADISYVLQNIPVTTPIRETWARIGGEWWYLQK